MKERHKAVPAAYLLLQKGDEVLLARRFNTGFQDGTYNVPSGHMEAGESPKACMIREAKEEIGIDVLEADLEFRLVLYRPAHDPTGDRICYFFSCRKWSGNVRNVEPHKCDDLRWTKFDDLPENMTPHVRAVFEAMGRRETYLELDVAFLKRIGMYQL